MRNVLLAVLLGSTLSFGGCGPVSGPFGSMGGEWQYACASPRKIGETCGSSDACVEGAYCSAAGSGTTGTCKARVALGGACMESEDCVAGSACKDIPVDGPCYKRICDAKGTCTQGPASGATCNIATGKDCPTGEICATAPPGPGTCVAAAKAGEACDGFRGIHMCAPGLTCQRITAKCVAPPGEGELCGFTVPFCAPGLVCRTDSDLAKDGRCGKPSPVGAPCGSGGMCEKGAHCDLRQLKCARNVGPGASCKSGNECGEAPFDVRNGVDCVRGTCVDTTKAGADCWPGEQNHCLPPLTCAPKK